MMLHSLVVGTNLFVGLHPLSRELLLQQVLEGLTILSELLDALVQLLEGHGVLKQCPAELGLVVDVRDLGDGLALGG